LRKSRLIILAALEMETRAIAKALGAPFLRNCVMRHASAAIEVHTIGMRATRLPQLLSVLSLTSEDRFWMAGLAGALDPALHVGDVVVDADPSGTDLPPSTGVSIRRGKIHTSDRLVALPADKGLLFAQTGALAVDMEQRIAREMLAPLSISVTGIRAISDTADTQLDPALLHLVDPIGRPKWPALAAAMFRRPALLLSLIRLERDSSRAARQLTRAIARLAELDPTKEQIGPGFDGLTAGKLREGQ
jgi:hypothetical protein